MSVPVWPGTVPHRPLRGSWRPGAPEGMTARRDMEDGPPLSRRKRLGEWTDVQPVIRMTAAELGAFRTFWRVTLNMGAITADMPVWIASAAAYQTRRVCIEGFTQTPAGGTQTLVALDMKVRDL